MSIICRRSSGWSLPPERIRRSRWPDLRAQGRLTELRAADLRFTPDEAAAFLNQVMDLHLSASDIAALEARTEGWIAGLQLAALSMQGRADSAAFVEAFTGSHRFVLDYLMEEVLQRQPEPVRRFLLQTSILDRLCGSLCDAVTEHAGGRSLLETLERGNLFVVPLDDQRQWYRYHHLFADVLHARLIDEQADGVSELHRRASAWFEQNDLPAEAIQHALLAKDFERAAALLERVWLAMDLSYQSAAWLRWAQQLPDDVIRAHPVLCLGYAWALLNGGELEAGEAWLRAAERWIDPTPEAAARMVVVDEAEYRALPAAIASARAYRASALRDIPGAIRHARQALALAAEDDAIRRRQATALLGVAEYASGDLPAAERSLLAFQATARQGGDMASRARHHLRFGEHLAGAGPSAQGDRRVWTGAADGGQAGSAAPRRVGSVSRPERAALRTGRSRNGLPAPGDRAAGGRASPIDRLAAPAAGVAGAPPGSSRQSGGRARLPGRGGRAVDPRATARCAAHRRAESARVDQARSMARGRSLG